MKLKWRFCFSLFPIIILLALGLNYYFSWRVFPIQWYGYFSFSLIPIIMATYLYTEKISPALAILNMAWPIPVLAFISWHYELNREVPHTDKLFIFTISLLTVALLALIFCFIIELVIKPKNTESQ